MGWLLALLAAISVCLVGRIFYDKTLFPQVFRIGITETITAEKEKLPQMLTLFFHHTKETTSEQNIETIIEETATAIRQSVTVEKKNSKTTVNKYGLIK